MNSYRIIPGGLYPDQGFYVTMTDADGVETHGTHRYPTRDVAEMEIERLKSLGHAPL
jgi:hypothetical protein